MIEFYSSCQILHAGNSAFAKGGNRFKMREPGPINSLFGLVIYAAPDHAAHNRMQVVAVGAFVPADQSTIFQFIKHRIQLELVSAGFVLADKHSSESVVASRHSKGSARLQHFLGPIIQFAK